MPDIKAEREWWWIEEDRLHVPRFPIRRDTHEWSVREVVISLVSDRLLERTSMKGKTAFIAASIRPIFVNLHEYRIA